MKALSLHYIGLILVIVSILISGCSGSSEDTDSGVNSDTIVVDKNVNITEKHDIITTALNERENKMYSPSEDTTYLYWLNNFPLIIENTSKCNIFALNTLFKAGYKTPKENALSRDLFNDLLFQDFMPIVPITSLGDIITGDLVVWKTHVIIFESLVYVKEKPYALGIWAGTSQKDNGKNIINNVNYSKYPLKGEFKVRRPQKNIQ
ncbi:MAG: hypothetical protein WC139_06230 [Candidatus Kapaibacterium sp.]